jgi:hypothetical protein
MLVVKEVKSYFDVRRFVEFPNKLYKGNPYYVPYLSVDERSLLNKKKNPNLENAEARFFLAYQDKKIVGRIGAIISYLYNEKTQQKRMRFTRFDCINDIEVARALLNKVEEYAKEKGMNIIHGPVGFNDLDREALLIEGFDEMSTFETLYNYPYYQELLEKLGYVKEADWLEYKIYPPKSLDEPLVKKIFDLSEAVARRYKLHIVEETNKKVFFKRYADGILECVNEAYKQLYSVIPLSDKVKKQIKEQFLLVINPKYVATVVDENDRVVGFGLAIPNIAKEVNKSSGHLLPFGLFRILHRLKHPEILDLTLIGVLPEYHNCGVNGLIMKKMITEIIKSGVKYTTAAPELEDNLSVLNQWKNFSKDQYRKRRCFKKEITI